MRAIPAIPFADPLRAERTLTRLSELLLTSGSSFSVEEFSGALSEQLAASPDADMALINLSRFAEAVLSKEALFNDLLRYPIQFELLMKLLGYSQYFSDILVRDPELFRWLTTSDSLVNPRTESYFSSEAQRVLRIFQRPERKLDGLRRLQRREILRIGARDILGEADLATVTSELSLLADAMIDACCQIAALQLNDRFPQRPKTEYAIIGLGKLGGAELNYSSDIDLMLVYKEEDEIEDSRGKLLTHVEYFHSFAEKLIHNLAHNSGEGHLYRVDFRLRPEGKMGPLARSLESHMLYYESRGELWERQMLIKARTVGGDQDFGREFIRQLQPFVYPRTFFQNPTHSIARIKSRIEAAIGDEENVKLRAGGIRDIEFVVQTLQLLNGGKIKEIRSATTLDAIARLVRHGLLSEREESTLKEAYIFFRTIEHRLQTMFNAQTHEMPREERMRTSLAKRMGLKSAAELHATYETLGGDVREIFDAVLSTSDSQGKQAVAPLLNGGDQSPQLLERYGIRDTKKAAKLLAAIDCGESFRSIIGTLLDDVSKTPSPDMSLHNFVTIASVQKFPDQFFAQLREENIRRLLVTLSSKSPRLTKGMARHPLALESLVHSPRLFDVAQKLALPDDRPLRDIKMEYELHIGACHVLGISTFDEMTAALSQLADAVIAAVLGDELKKHHAARQSIAIFALGKYGTREINFDSDLDVVFISDVRSATAKDMLEKAATRIVGQLSSVGEGGKLYDVDARLRPEGKNAPLVVDRKAYLTYLSQRASLWERQSLTRFRFIAGDNVLAEKVPHDVEAFVYETPLPRNWVEDIVAMRKKTETRSKVSSRDFVDVKLGSGGMVDVEFLAQMLQLKFGTTVRSMRDVPTMAAIRSSPFPIPREQLVDAYQLYRRIETLLRTAFEERGSILPEKEKLELLAELMGYSDGGELRDHVLSTMKKTRQIFLTTAEQLA